MRRPRTPVRWRSVQSSPPRGSAVSRPVKGRAEAALRETIPPTLALRRRPLAPLFVHWGAAALMLCRGEGPLAISGPCNCDLCG